MNIAAVSAGGGHDGDADGADGGVASVCKGGLRKRAIGCNSSS